MSIPQSVEGKIETYEQLVYFLENGCKPLNRWGIGTEHEKFGYDKENFMPLPYGGDISIYSILTGLRDTYGWAEIREKDKLIGLQKAVQI